MCVACPHAKVKYDWIDCKGEHEHVNTPLLFVEHMGTYTCHVSFEELEESREFTVTGKLNRIHNYPAKFLALLLLHNYMYGVNTHIEMSSLFQA